MKVVIFGAGASGRGHVGQLAYASGYQLIFVDKDESLVAALQSAGQYTVHLVGAQERDVVIRGFRAYPLRAEEAIAEEIAACDLVLTAVTAEGLPGLVPCLARGLERRAQRGVAAPVNVIACENMINGSTALKGMLLPAIAARYRSAVESCTGFPDAMIARVVPAPAGDRLRLLAEDHNEWPVDARAFRGPDPGIDGLELVDNLQARLERKIYMHNTGHAVCGYLGYLKGYAVMCDAVLDPVIRRAVYGAMTESAQTLRHTYGFSWESLEEYRDSFFPRVEGRLILDPVARVCRSPRRKLGRQERLLGPACRAIDLGLEAVHLALGIAAALRYDAPDDPEAADVQALLHTGGVGAVLQQIGAVDAERLARLQPLVEQALAGLPALLKGGES